MNDRVLLLIGLLVLPLLVKAEDQADSAIITTEEVEQFAEGYLQKGVELGVGFGVSTASFSTDSSHEVDSATMTSGFSFSPVIGFKSELNKFKDSNFGYYYHTVLTTYELDKQDLDLNSDLLLSDVENMGEVDLGTSVKGVALSVTPVFVYEKVFSSNAKLHAGLGVGLGYLSVKGDYFETEESASLACRASTTITQVQQSCVKQNIDESGVDVSVGLLLGYYYKNYALSITNAGPTVSNAQFSEYKFNVSYVVKL